VNQVFRGSLERISLADIINIKVLGFTTTLAWSYLTFFSTTIHYSTRNDIAHLNSTYTFMLLGSLATLIFMGALPQRFRFVSEHWWTRIAAPLTLSVATFLLALVEADWFRQPWCTIICVSSGLALGFMYLGWGVVFKRQSPQHSVAMAIVSFSLAALIFTLVLALPRMIAITTTIALPLLAGFCLTRAVHDRGRLHLLEPVDLNKPGYLRNALLSVGVLTLAAAFMRSLFLQAAPVGSAILYPWVFLAATAVALLILIVSLLVVRDNDYGMAYRVVLFAMIAIFLAMPLVPTRGFIADVLSLSTYCSLNMLIWILLARTASTYQLGPVTIFGFGWGASTFGTLVGDFIGRLIESYTQVDSSLVGMVLLICVLAVLFAYFFLFDEKAMISLTNEDLEDGRSGKTYMVFRRRPFRSRCEEIAHRFELSTKETEVMILFAKGRSNPRIQEELNIAPGTVNTHLSHVYKKLNVHDKQSLIDLLEGQERPV
jgi:DNA-binding CsgD family transcriptional regulator/MFS family permease